MDRSPKHEYYSTKFQIQDETINSTIDSLPLLVDINDNYKTIRELGSGTYGRVLLAYNRDQQQRFALKVLPKITTKFRDFQREYNYSMLLTPHRSIISTFETCYQTHDSFILVQEYAPLGDLFESIPPQKGLPEKHAKIIMKQIASALEFMHDKSLIHRDVKPENVMIFDADFHKVKLIDFGMTRKCGSYVRRLIGSIPYSPPEVCDATTNDILVTSAMDIWAFGVLLFCTLTGNFPWEHAQESDTYYNEFLMWQKRKRRKLPSQWFRFNPRLMRLFKKMLDPLPENRCEIHEICKYYDDRWINENVRRRPSNEDEGVEEDYSSGDSTNGTDLEELTKMLKDYGFDHQSENQLIHHPSIDIPNANNQITSDNLQFVNKHENGSDLLSHHNHYKYPPSSSTTIFYNTTSTTKSLFSN
ncbi:unnamed protein product [Didymodactylos carnosus]|uniref:Protein kinase domain-containing protein n=1 Tax=Didymodactylos carnosus TaxID=1234261 RepID=A0A813XGG3_9BILA|nr:unnamed protein product [Didymodactylos carnosus]CAF0938356.1 unnamed protein product [Didymodactylos carnosus]CAF3658463.1 unnamed protein product [Didymodactylos carnosus]CAF3713802.1 unnamed protein product [Didymodactylos carnosus]